MPHAHVWRHIEKLREAYRVVQLHSTASGHVVAVSLELYHQYGRRHLQAHSFEGGHTRVAPVAAPCVLAFEALRGDELSQRFLDGRRAGSRQLQLAEWLIAMPGIPAHGTPQRRAQCAAEARIKWHAAALEVLTDDTHALLNIVLLKRFRAPPAK